MLKMQTTLAFMSALLALATASSGNQFWEDEKLQVCSIITDGTDRQLKWDEENAVLALAHINRMEGDSTYDPEANENVEIVFLSEEQAFPPAEEEKSKWKNFLSKAKKFIPKKKRSAYENDDDDDEMADINPVLLGLQTEIETEKATHTETNLLRKLIDDGEVTNVGAAWREINPDDYPNSHDWRRNKKYAVVFVFSHSAALVPMSACLLIMFSIAHWWWSNLIQA